MGKGRQALCNFIDCVHPPGDVRCKLHHLEDATACIEDRVVGSLDPDHLAALADALELLRDELPARQRLPEVAIGIGLRVCGFAEHRVLFAGNFADRVAEGGEKVLVGRQDLPGRGEFDGRLHTRDRFELARIFRRLQFRGGDVGRELDDLPELAVLEDRVVGGLDPDLAAVLADALVFPAIELSAVEHGPELAIVLRCGVARIAEDAMMFALDLLQAVAKSETEILVCRDDRPVELELDHRLRTAQRVENGLRFKSGKCDQCHINPQRCICTCRRCNQGQF